MGSSQLNAFFGRLLREMPNQLQGGPYPGLKYAKVCINEGKGDSKWFRMEFSGPP
jgi:hypothetical protein